MNPNDENSDRDLAEKAAALPRAIEPGRDLWAGVAGRIESKRKRAVLARRSIAGASLLLAAAAIVLAIRTGKHSPSAIHTVPTVAAPAPVPTPAPTVTAALLPEEASYATALAALTPVFEERRKDLPEDGARAIEKSLSAIDAAITATRAALAVDPGDDDLRSELDSEYEQKIDTMNDVLDWTTRS